MYSNPLPNEDKSEHPKTGHSIAEQPITEYQQGIEQNPQHNFHLEEVGECEVRKNSLVPSCQEKLLCE